MSRTTWSGQIAGQTYNWRGTSSFSIFSEVEDFPSLRVITGAAYTLRVTGGVSGTFGVVVVGNIGGSTVNLAGLTAITAAGTYVMFPVGYSSTGAGNAIGGVQVSMFHRLDQLIQPSVVALQSAIATVGISAACTIHATITRGD